MNPKTLYHCQFKAYKKEKEGEKRRKSEWRRERSGIDKDPDAHLELALAFKLAMRVALAARASSDAGRTIPEDSAPPTALASPAIVEAILRRPADRARMLPLDHIFLERCPKPPTLRNPGQILKETVESGADFEGPAATPLQVRWQTSCIK